MKRESQRHLIKGVSQYEYLKSLGSKLTGEARGVLDTFLDKWNWKDVNNPNLEEAKKREAARSLWRAYYD